MGSMKFSRLRLYWNPLLGIEAFRKIMTCDRFSQLRNNLHIVNNLDMGPNITDKIFKVRPIIDAIRNRCLQVPVEEIISVDEQIIPYTGRLSTKQYVKGKPNPWGIKVYVLAGKSGMSYDFILYQGSTTGLSASQLSKFGFGAAVVLKLSERLVNEGHTIFFDNFFTSYNLLERLSQLKQNAAGTIRVNRFAKPPLITDKDLMKKGRGLSDMVVSQDGGINVVKWQDNKAIHLASNFIGIGTQDEVKRYNKSKKTYEIVQRPEIVQQYNFGMGGVDLLDQFVSYYRVFIKSKKWPLRIFTHFLDVALVASWLEYKNYCIKKGKRSNEILHLLNFRLEVANVLIYANQKTTSANRGRPTQSQRNTPESSPVSTKRLMEVRPLKEVQLDGVDHMPNHDGKKEATRCKMNCLTTQRTAGRTHFFCQKCKIHLCITKERNCFLAFHTK